MPAPAAAPDPALPGAAAAPDPPRQRPEPLRPPADLALAGKRNVLEDLVADLQPAMRRSRAWGRADRESDWQYDSRSRSGKPQRFRRLILGSRGLPAGRGLKLTPFLLSAGLSPGKKLGV